MSEALKSMTSHETRTGQAPAGVGATLAYNMIIKDVLPRIVDELEKKIADLQEQVSSIKRPAGNGAAAARALQGGRHRTRRYTRRR